MQKRLMINMPFWMADYFETIRDNYPHLTQAEIARFQICLGVIRITELMHPEYKPYFHEKELDCLASFKAGDKGFRQRFFERVDFEAQKAIDYRQEKGSLPRRNDA